MPSATDNPAHEEAMEPSAEANHMTIFNFVISFLFAHIINHLKPSAGVWIHYCERIFGEEAVEIMPSSPFSFIITTLIAFAEIKSQGSEFPFQTHPVPMNVVITSLLFYGLASAAEHLISATCLGPTSLFAIISRLGKIGCLCVLVASLASLFYL